MVEVMCIGISMYRPHYFLIAASVLLSLSCKSRSTSSEVKIDPAGSDKIAAVDFLPSQFGFVFSYGRGQSNRISLMKYNNSSRSSREQVGYFRYKKFHSSWNHKTPFIFVERSGEIYGITLDQVEAKPGEYKVSIKLDDSSTSNTEVSFTIDAVSASSKYDWPLGLEFKLGGVDYVLQNENPGMSNLVKGNFQFFTRDDKGKLSKIGGIHVDAPSDYLWLGFLKQKLQATRIEQLALSFCILLRTLHKNGQIEMRARTL